MKTHTGIPLPEKTIPQRPPRWKYPYATMEVGACFFVPCPTDARRRSMTSHTSDTGKQLGRKFETRFAWVKPGKEKGGWDQAEQGEKGAQPGIGIWRTE